MGLSNVIQIVHSIAFLVWEIDTSWMPFILKNKKNYHTFQWENSKSIRFVHWFEQISISFPSKMKPFTKLIASWQLSLGDSITQSIYVIKTLPTA